LARGKKLNKPIYFLINILIIFWIFNTGCEREPIRIQSVSFLPQNENVVGKFLLLCLTRNLRESEKIQVRAIFATKSAKKFERTFIIYGPSGLDKKTKCIKKNLFLTLDRLSRLDGNLRSSEVRARETLKNHVEVGNIRTLQVLLGDNLNLANQIILDQKTIHNL